MICFERIQVSISSLNKPVFRKTTKKRITFYRSKQKKAPLKRSSMQEKQPRSERLFMILR